MTHSLLAAGLCWLTSGDALAGGRRKRGCLLAHTGRGVQKARWKSCAGLCSGSCHGSVMVHAVDGKGEASCANKAVHHERQHSTLRRGGTSCVNGEFTTSAPVLRRAGRHLRMLHPVPVGHAGQVRNRPHSNLRQPAQEHRQEIIKPGDRSLQTNILIGVLSGSDRTCPKRVHLVAAMLNGG